MIAAVDWGNVPAWIGLVAGLAVLSGFVAGRLDAARDPAARVYVLVDYAYGEPRPGESPYTKVAVVNDGDLPIFDVWIAVWGWGDRRRFWRLRRHDRWLSSVRLESQHIAQLPPNTTIAARTMTGLGPKPRPKGSDIPPIVAVFRDGNGRLWVRWPDGGLQRALPSRWLRR